jgi:aryl-alcohol dehydrogenase-like predicted oxidoreductase
MRDLGIDTAKKISRIGLGTWQFGSREWGYGESYAGQTRPACCSACFRRVPVR